MEWLAVKESKLVWAPAGTRTTKKGEEKTRFIRLGVRVEMMDGSWWFFSFKHASWTKHWPRVRRMDKLGRPATNPDGTPDFLPERKDRYTTLSLHREWNPRRPELVSALERAVDAAEESS